MAAIGAIPADALAGFTVLGELATPGLPAFNVTNIEAAAVEEDFSFFAIAGRSARRIIPPPCRRWSAAGCA
jgi:hypothetical protein